MDLGFDVVVTITGIVLVFLILVLLMAIITLEGKIFDGLGKKKAAAKAAVSKPAAPAKPAAPVQQAAAPAPQVEEGIPGDEMCIRDRPCGSPPAPACRSCRPDSPPARSPCGDR